MRTLSDRFRSHFGDAEHVYGVLLRAMADDWDANGVVRKICDGREDSPPGAFVQLRLLAGIHRLVLTDRASQLVRFYPYLGGTADPRTAWPAFEPVLRAHVAELRAALDVAPQTNEPGRSAALLLGLFEAARQSGLSRLRLLEPGASAGLNLLVDEFRIGGRVPAFWQYGPPESPLAMTEAVIGPVVPLPLQIVERRGCDLSPVDAGSAEGQLRLTSFVWPHHVERHERLRGALQVAAQHPVTVDRAGAAAWLSEQLSVAAVPDVLTVVWHSVTRLYWPVPEVIAVEGILAAAGERMPLAEVSMEYPHTESGARAELRVILRRPGHASTEVLLATVEDHGIPVRIE